MNCAAENISDWHDNKDNRAKQYSPRATPTIGPIPAILSSCMSMFLLLGSGILSVLSRSAMAGVSRLSGEKIFSAIFPQVKYPTTRIAIPMRNVYIRKGLEKKFIPWRWRLRGTHQHRFRSRHSQLR